MKNISLERIMNNVCSYYKVEKFELKNKGRKAHVVNARQVYCYLATLHTDFSLYEIGLSINRDHATVLFARDKIKLHCDLYYNTRKNINDLVNLIMYDCDLIIKDVNLLELCTYHKKSFLN